MRELIGFWTGCALIVAVAVMTSGCGSTESDYVRFSNEYVSENLMREIKLSDGTQCVLFAAGGISCDWEAKR